MIEIKNLCKRFDDHVIFDGFSLKINTGDFILITGNSGCGKTTLLNMIGGLEKPDSGEIIIDGENIYKKKNNRDFYLYKVGFLFQNFALIENKTVSENIMLVQKKARSEITLDDALSFTGIKEKANTKVYKLSGGEQQRVAIARLIFKKCEIILADEPTGSLDAGNTDTVMKLLHKINDRGKTVIIVTHNERIIETERNVVML